MNGHVFCLIKYSVDKKKGPFFALVQQELKEKIFLRENNYSLLPFTPSPNNWEVQLTKKIL